MRRPEVTAAWTRVKGHRVAVDGDANFVQQVFGLLAVELGLDEINEDQVHVGAAGDQLDARVLCVVRTDAPQESARPRGYDAGDP